VRVGGSNKVNMLSCSTVLSVSMGNTQSLIRQVTGFYLYDWLRSLTVSTLSTLHFCQCCQWRLA
jgi:hypothetical protein